jgi:hypothetical protein
MVLRTLLIPKGQKGVEEEERFVKIEREKRENRTGSINCEILV